MIMLSNTRPLQHLSSIFDPNLVRSGKTMRSIFNTVSKDLDIEQKRILKKTLSNLQNNPEAVNFSNITITTKQAINKALKPYLKGKYKNNLSGAVSHVKGMFKSPEKAGADAKKDIKVKFSKEKEQLAEKRRMWGRAREARQEKDLKKRGAIKSIGLNEWQSSKGSIGQALGEEKKKEKEETSKEVQDMVID